MSKIFTSVSQLIGRTPLLELCGIEKSEGLNVRLLVKLEGRNPAGSAKDRVALSMILDAERRGILKPGSTIIEPTSGNTGIGLCAVAAARGYKCIILMPDTMSLERQKRVTMEEEYGLVLKENSELEQQLGATDAYRARALELEAEVADEFLPYLYPNQYVWYTSGSKAIALVAHYYCQFFLVYKLFIVY